MLKRTVHLCILLQIYIILILSCSEEPIFDNPFDPDTEIQPPTNFTATPISDSQIKLTWQKSSEVLTGYIIDKKEEGENNYQLLVELNKNDSEYIDTAVTVNIEYYYRLKGKSGDNLTDISEVNAHTSPPSITIISPDGGEDWISGSSYSITWTGIFISNYVKIELYKDGIYYSTIKSSTYNNGSYNWDIPDSYVESSYYKIKITDIGNSSTYDYSDDYFSILEPPSITIMSPNGDENWNLGSSHYITWTSTNVGNYVKIELYKGGIYYSTINSSTYNDGSYNWNIPDSFDESSYYKIKITSFANDSIFDYSDNYFTILHYNEIYEDFNDGVADNWIDDGSGRWSVYSGKCYMNGNNSETDALSYYNNTFDNFTFEADIIKVSGGYATALYFRGDGVIIEGDYQNGYLFDVDIDSNAYSVWKRIDGELYALIGWTSSSYLYGIGQTNHLKVICNDGDMTFYINGNYIDSINDSSFSSGYVGLWAADHEDDVVSFDNVHLTFDVSKSISGHIIKAKYSSKNEIIGSSK